MYLPVHFYYPSATETGVPDSAEHFAEWQCGLATTARNLGPATWIVQTALELRARGFPCTLTDAIPEEGIVVAHRSQVPSPLPVARNRYWVCALADKPPPHPYCNFHVLQNPTQFLVTGQPTAYVPHWAQPGLRSRDPARGDTVVSIGFFGQEENLAPELASAAMLAWYDANGYRFAQVPRDRWHDYSSFDVSLAIRSFEDTTRHPSKPVTKLVNGWMAGVPVVAGVESAFRAEGRPGVDYLEGRTLDDVKSHLLALRGDAQLRNALVEEGRRAAVRFAPDAIAARWIDVLAHQVAPRVARWRAQYPLRASYMRATARIWEGLGWRSELTGSRARSRANGR